MSECVCVCVLVFLQDHTKDWKGAPFTIAVSVHLFVCSSTFPSMHPSIYPSTHQPTCPFMPHMFCAQSYFIPHESCGFDWSLFTSFFVNMHGLCLSKVHFWWLMKTPFPLSRMHTQPQLSIAPTSAPQQRTPLSFWWRMLCEWLPSTQWGTSCYS